MWSRNGEVMTDSSVPKGATSGTETGDNAGNVTSETTVTVEVETHTVPRTRSDSEHMSDGASVQEASVQTFSTSPSVTNLASQTATPPAPDAHTTNRASTTQPSEGSAQAGNSSGDHRRHSSPRVTEQASATAVDMSGHSGDNVHSRSNSRRQRNGLFGINIDLNFDPSWLVPSNVAGRSISSLSMLPDWARPTIAIPNRESPTANVSESRQGNSHHASSMFGTDEEGGGPANRLMRDSTLPRTSSGTHPRNPMHASSSHSSSSTSNIHQHMLPRTRHTLSSMRSMDDDLDADYNPVSPIDLGAGRERGSHSYVIDMDSQMGMWGSDPDEEVVTQQRGGGNSSNADTNGASGPGANHPGNNGGNGSRPSSIAETPLQAAASANERARTAEIMRDATTAANERTRAAEILRDAPETRAFINEISRYTTIRPFLIINFLKGVFDHGTSILAFLALVVTFSHANSMVKKEVSKQRKRNLLYLLMIVINLAACVAFIYYIFNEMELYYALVFLPTAADLSSFWSLMWAVGVTDYVAKFGSVLLKICIVALPGCVIPFQKRGKYYLFIEHSSQVYRSFLPMYPWMFYLVSAYEGTARMFGLFLAGLYIIFKITDSVGRFKEWLKALEKLLSNVHYGTSPTEEQRDSAGNICPICHDKYVSPTRLSCSHIFCEECVATWFDRERTCPMCRAKVVDDPTYRDGSTSQYVQLF